MDRKPDVDGPRAGRPAVPDGRAAVRYQPGVVEVQLRERLRPRVAGTLIEADGDVAGVNGVLRRFGLRRAEPSLRTPYEEATEAQESARSRGFDVPHLGDILTLHFDADADTAEIARQLSRLPEVERAVAIPVATPPVTLAEPLLGGSDQVGLDAATGLENQWYVFRCRADRAWAHASGDGVVVADVDFGCRITHLDLAGAIEPDRVVNSFDGGTDVACGEDWDHGTGVLGLAGARANDLGMVGMAFGAALWVVQANDGRGPELPGNAWANGVDWVRTTSSGGRRKVVLVEVQNGGWNSEAMPALNAAIRHAIAAGSVVCMAAGNGDRDAGLDWDGNVIPETGSILVGATEYDPNEDRRWYASNFSTRIGVCAPGSSEHDLTCGNGSDFAYTNGFGGTSGATPKVGAVAALMLNADPALPHARIRKILHDTGRPVITEPGKPIGRFLDAEAAVRKVQSSR